MSLTYRQIEVLTALAENPKGLTTAEIFYFATKKAGSEIPNKDVVSKITCYMRGHLHLITTSNGIHQITPEGIEAVKAYEKTVDDALPADDISEPVEFEAINELQTGTVDEADPLLALEDGINVFIAAFRSIEDENRQLKTARLVIDDKPEKLAVLRHFQQFTKPVNEDMYSVLTDIIADIEAAA